MKPSEIRAGATYSGPQHDDEPADATTWDRTVREIVRDDEHNPVVEYLCEECQGDRGHVMDLGEFAEWAVREVPAGREGGEGQA